jgi:putative tryptophan/tyrosine transport system substrate-binding protein
MALGAVDPVEQGFVASLAHPGGNATGFTNFEFSIAGKWLELLKNIEPRLARVAVVGGPGTGDTGWFHAAKAFATSFGVELLPATVHDEAEIEQAITGLAEKPGGGLIDLPDVFTRNHRQTIIDLSAKYRIASIRHYVAFSPSRNGAISGPRPAWTFFMAQLVAAASAVPTLLNTA